MKYELIASTLKATCLLWLYKRQKLGAQLAPGHQLYLFWLICYQHAMYQVRSVLENMAEGGGKIVYHTISLLDASLSCCGNNALGFEFHNTSTYRKLSCKVHHDIMFWLCLMAIIKKSAAGFLLHACEIHSLRTEPM